MRKALTDSEKELYTFARNAHVLKKYTLYNERGVISSHTTF
jgi:hypothetical protein